MPRGPFSHLKTKKNWGIDFIYWMTFALYSLGKRGSGGGGLIAFSKYQGLTTGQIVYGRKITEPEDVKDELEKKAEYLE